MKIFVTAITGSASAVSPEEGLTILATHRDREAASEFFHDLVDDAIEDGGFSKTPMEEDERDDRAVFQHAMEHPMDAMDEVYLYYWEDANRDLHMVDGYQNQYMICTAEELK